MRCSSAERLMLRATPSALMEVYMLCELDSIDSSAVISAWMLEAERAMPGCYGSIRHAVHIRMHYPTTRIVV